MDYNTAPGVEISLDDVDEERFINNYILSEEESRLKEAIWKCQNADYIQKQKIKEALKKQGLDKPKSTTQYSQYSNDQYSESYKDSENKFETKS